MTAVSAKDVKELRDRTDAPMMDCRNALVEASGNVEKAIKILKEKGKTKAAKRAGKETTQGAVALKVNDGNHGAAAVMVGMRDRLRREERALPERRVDRARLRAEAAARDRATWRCCCRRAFRPRGRCATS